MGRVSLDATPAPPLFDDLKIFGYASVFENREFKDTLGLVCKTHGAIEPTRWCHQAKQRVPPSQRAVPSSKDHQFVVPSSQDPFGMLYHMSKTKRKTHKDRDLKFEREIT